MKTLIALCSSLKCQGSKSVRPIEKPNQPTGQDLCIDCRQTVRWVTDRGTKIHQVGSNLKKYKHSQDMFAGFRL